ncbi:MAG: hypothetical protein KC502_01875 [Myxococcales bacterium]|nr:hypothetical protein [Myxococcales bacterium]
MLFRILVLIGAGLALWSLWRLIRPHPLKRIPMRWRVLASSAPTMREALRIRASMVRVLLRGHGTGTSGLVGDVDRLIETIARAVQLRSEARALSTDDSTTKQATAQIKDALGQLSNAHAHLLDAARVEIDSAIVDIRGQLSEHTDHLRLTVEAQREVEALVKKQRDEQTHGPRHDELARLGDDDEDDDDDEGTV